ncbi:MAG: SOS response-associated peptidase family protein, partial [Pseudolabrys sp.]
KQPYYFSTENGAPLTIAGLWDEWKDIETGVPLRSCTMIITTANEFVGKIHDRMPALLTPYQFDSWLSGDAGPESLRPWDQRSLQMYPVSRTVNSSKAAADDPTLIERIEV